MSYQVLARKWRPRLFREMVGQEHVLKALINALDHDRLHHAYLFTGTRGVGKTTIARILAKCLNCETGVSSEPCNQCSSCTEINEGRFVDLIEVDAASRTKVEDTRELLDNVQYLPTRGRYKVYLIDEVHMLSNSSFNALLKTLEEPPPHVKFLLATTDPQKLPVTVLSRCLQFNLKNMSAERIVDHLQAVLTKEMVPYEEAGLWQLGRAADGSMRDALSLTDQAIAYSGGKITDADVRTMLGTIDLSLVNKIIHGLVQEEAAKVLETVADLSEHSPDYTGVLAELINTLHRIAIAQALPEAIDNSLGDRQQIYDFAQRLSAEEVQLYYQTALMGRRDLPLAPDTRSGFEMVLLRMLAFKPQGLVDIPSKPLSTHGGQKGVNEPSTAGGSSKKFSQGEYNREPSADGFNKKPDAEKPGVEKAPQSPSKPEEGFLTDQSKLEDFSASDRLSESEPSPLHPGIHLDQDSETQSCSAIESVAERDTLECLPTILTGTKVEQCNDKFPLDDLTTENWVRLYLALAPGGLLQSTAVNSVYRGRRGSVLAFTLDEQQSTLYDDTHQQRLADLLTDYFQQPLEVTIQVGQTHTDTPAQIILQQQRERHRLAEQAILADPVVKQLQTTFGAEIMEGSIKPID